MVAIEYFVIALLAVISSASIHQRQEARVISSCTTPNTVALTFNDGPWIYLKEVSDALTNANATGTFFFNGNNYACIYDTESVDRVLYAVNHGHQVASHTWNNTDLTTLSHDQINNEMSRIEEALQKIAGVHPAFMRPPYGSYDPEVLTVVASRNQSVAMWDFDSGDSTGSTPDQSKVAYDALIAQKPSNILALNHETQETTVHQVLPHVIKELQAAGYRLVSLAECVDLPPYQNTQAPGVRDSSWTCNQ